MKLAEPPLPPDIWAATPAAAQTLMVALQERIRDLEAPLGQNASNSSRPPSTDPAQAPPRPTAPPTGRKRGGQPGPRGACHALLPVEQVDEIVPVDPERCRHRGQPLPETATGRRGRVWRHQVLELLPWAVRVTEYQMMARLPRRGQENPDRKTAALCRELTKWWTALWTFSRLERVEPTNNVAECCPRPVVRWRKRGFGSDSDTGSQIAQHLLTLVAACRQQGRPLLGFFGGGGPGGVARQPGSISTARAPRTLNAYLAL